ncbi:hypothetical protein D1871_01250 [Nakamurella silvestris]|nr:hypothetical protein D1871_01250 [Nakamurella silvestris]
MRFNSKARLDTSQVQDTRSSGGGGGGGGGLGNLSGMAKGGGGLGIVAILIFAAFQIFGGSSGGGAAAGGLLTQLTGGNGGNATVDNAKLEQSCKTGADANTDPDCALVAVINSIQAFWTDEMAGSGTTYQETDTVFFSGNVNTGCGAATSATGPFYCPADQLVYVDLTFFNELATQFGANDAVFTRAYVLAHEYGHHVQNLLGTSDKVGTATGPTSGSVRLELQADCYAGVWANHATTVPGADGQVLIEDLTDTDIANALDAAAKIGDDYIQTHLGGGQVNEAAFSHGSSAQRKKWFTEGLTNGDPTRCDTFKTGVNLG